MNSKKKGNIWENKFANWLRDNGIKAWKDGASGGGNREKADVGNNINLHFEVKAVKRINLMEVWNKACHECTKTHNEPVLAIHFNNMPDNEWLMVVHSEHFLQLLTKEQGVDTSYEDPKRKWEIKNLIEAAKKVLKHYE